MTSLDSSPPNVRSRDYAVLSQTIRQAGLLRRRYRYYTVKIALNVLVFAGGWVLFVQLGDSWWQLFVAAFFAVMFAQLAFIGHDAGHKQILRGRRTNDLLGYWHGGMVGLSYGWWMDQHTSHHANPNHEQDDPDIRIPALAFTESQGGAKRGFLRWLAKYQAFLFFPLLLLEGFSLHVSSVQTLRRPVLRARKVEIALLAGHFAAYLTAVFLVLSPLTAVVFILVHQCLWGVYMGCSFAPGHKGMPILARGHGLDFLRRQVLTSRNVRGGIWVDFVLGGLNYQIEHHLFPTMPRPNLRRAQPIVRNFCAQQGIEYAECGWPRTYGYVLQHLHAVGVPLRAGR
ncbi:acyl-CoA desaturase [Amycolatopsis acidiphila]|uniref:Acyl-CoA desaturase n=1 Tax=Amycolatopsis acidiphila TaxID=715473 RepID=A0A557ZYS8_9PSEU|nr:acyl-CoA desaturase [Amycolatopsis acidiphila]TVT17166.1 acyl-CoA desaturase [Amycolatopsis acidiphila]UIJ63074.1 acyl-CoA desaturase [Amycolatopsis acidiphila]GHG65981.1 fatty acid desaturase [Amycolatopsis acidiphila]